jgi:hypothetical protein
MKSHLLLLAICLVVSCSNQNKSNDHTISPIKRDPVADFQGVVRDKGEIEFESWNGKLRGLDNDYRLIFRADSNAILQEFGYAGEDNTKGVYSIRPDGRITLNLQKYHWNWPSMMLRYDSGDLVLFREDGVTAWPIEATKILDSNAPRIEGFWPFRSSSKEAPSNDG